MTSTAGTGRTTTGLPFLDLRSQYASIRAEILEAVTNVLEDQHFILGPQVEAFENEVGALTGSRYSIGCASGTDALILALLALEVGRFSGDRRDKRSPTPL